MMWPWDDPEYKNEKDNVSEALTAKEAVDYAGGFAPLRQAAAYAATRAAPIAMGALATTGTAVPLGMVAGAAIPGAARSLYDALPLPENRYSRIRQAGANARRNFYDDVGQGRYLSAGRDFAEANALTLGQYLRDLVPTIPGGGQ